MALEGPSRSPLVQGSHEETEPGSLRRCMAGEQEIPVVRWNRKATKWYRAKKNPKTTQNNKKIKPLEGSQAVEQVAQRSCALCQVFNPHCMQC